MEFLLFFAALVVFVAWAYWYKSLFRIHSFRSINKGRRILLAVLPLVCIAFLVLALVKHASGDVRSRPAWILFYTLGGAVWLRFGLSVSSFLGISPRDDVLERQNAAASWVIFGMLIGLTFCYTGANVGNGPGPEVVFFCALLSTASLFLLWFCLERTFRLADRITIDRDKACGLRAGAWISSLGLLFGVGVTGDWHSLEQTLRDFLPFALAAAAFFLAAVVFESYYKSRSEGASLGTAGSAVVALGYLIAASLFAVWRGLR